MTSGQIVEKAHSQLSGVLGQIILALVAKRNLSSSRIKEWVKRLRAAADTLEEIVK